MEKRIGPVTLRYIPGDTLDLVITYDAGDLEPWVGAASFPWNMEDEALSWLNRIQSENDIEDLLRLWAPEETWWAFQRLRNVVGV